jgi:hypothetical protein
VSSSPSRASDLAASVDLDQPIDALNDALQPLEQAYVEEFSAPTEPVLFIVGAPRSGTTLLSQLLIAKYRIGYVSNLVSRFWKAPYLGLLIMQDVREADQLLNVNFSSEHGFTSGYEGPHEFGYFWRRWFDYQDSHHVAPDRLSDVDADALRRECAAMQSVQGGPFLFKNLVCSFQVGFLARTLPNAVFIHCRRTPIFVAQSLLKCRDRRCDRREDWFSVKPKAYPELRSLPYPDQIAGQIYHTRRHVEDAFADLDDGRYARVDYEALVDAPQAVLDQIAGAVEQQGGTMRERSGFSVPDLQSTNSQRVPDDEFECLQSSCRQFFSTNPSV